MIVVSLGICPVQAQYVEKVGTKIFIDVQDMPNGTWTTVSLNSSHNEASSVNTLYKRFEVANTDESGDVTWTVAKTTCANRGIGWRLPTQKELLLMGVMKDMLILAGSLPFNFIGYYWSSTTVLANSAETWYVRIDSDRMTSSLSNTTPLSVRCIREVPN